ncbi:MAG: GerMN domain-containing protein [Clostridia bacterium]|nr:GerMN domain-containing protein [Clostridia bacterium]
MKKRMMCCLVLCCLLATGCSSRPALTPAPAASMPVADAGDVQAPIGDVALDYTATAALCLPSADGQQVLTIYEPLSFTYSLHPAETILRALLAHPGSARVRPVSAVTIVPAGSDPVEISGGVATVNLSASALEISREELHTVCRCITATLCELPDVDYVNVLVAGVPVAMDSAGYLPLGAITAQPGQELPVMWEQLLARRTPEGALPASAALTSAVTLYFPLADGSGIIPETRRIAFAGQHPQQLVTGLLEALSANAENLPETAAFPPLNQLLLSAPEVTTLPDGSLRVTLRFTGDLRSWLTNAGADPACAFAAIVTTLTTFVPSLREVCLYTGERGVTGVACPAQGSLLFPDAIHTRAAYSGYLQTLCTVYGVSGPALTPMTVSLPYRSIYSPRALLLSLPAGDAPNAVLPEPIADSDVLGLAIQGDTLTINLSARYANVLRSCPEQQRLIAYAIVNMMCSGVGVRRVRFCFDSAVTASLGSDILWSGDFLYCPGLIR